MNKRLRDPRSFLLLLLLLCLPVLSSSPSLAIVIRHDRPDSLYRELGRRLPPLVQVGLAHGTLIAPNWVLTAAQVADGISPLSGTVRLENRDLPVKRIVLHPTWIGDLGSGMADPGWIDMALIQLATPVHNVPPVALHEGEIELGTPVFLVGRGGTGNGLSGPKTSDHQVRGATNVVERLDDSWVYFAFSAPPRAAELEGISGPGDRGGPALVEMEGQYRIVGVSSRNDPRDEEIECCTYGSVDVYTRVSSQTEWLRSMMGSDTGPGCLIDLEKHGWPETPAAMVARSFFAVYNSGSEKGMTDFQRTHRTAEQLRISPAETQANVWVSRRESWGHIDPVKLVEMNDYKLFVLVRSNRHWRSFYFEVEGDDPHGLRTISVSLENRVHGQPLPPVTAGHEGN